MVHNMAIDNMVLPFPQCTDVHNEANWVYDLRAKPQDEAEPMDIREIVAADGATDDEYD